MMCGNRGGDVRSVGRWRLRAGRFRADATGAALFRKCNGGGVAAAVHDDFGALGAELLEERLLGALRVWNRITLVSRGVYSVGEWPRRDPRLDCCHVRSS